MDTFITSTRGKHARKPHAYVLHEYAQQQVSASSALNLEAEAQHTFERLIIGRAVFGKGWRLWVMRELFNLRDGPLSALVRLKLSNFLKAPHHN